MQQASAAATSDCGPMAATHGPACAASALGATVSLLLNYHRGFKDQKVQHLLA